LGLKEHFSNDKAIILTMEKPVNGRIDLVLVQSNRVQLFARNSRSFLPWDLGASSSCWAINSELPLPHIDSSFGSEKSLSYPRQGAFSTPPDRDTHITGERRQSLSRINLLIAR